MEFFDIIKKRRSIRKYKVQAIPWDDVAKILQAGKAAPIAGNVFNMRFVVVKNHAKRAAIAQACMDQQWMQDAPIHIVVCADHERLEKFYGVKGAHQYSLHNSGAAMQNMILAATRLGLGTCWIEAFNEDELKAMMGIPSEISIQCILVVGHAAERPVSPSKKMIEEIVFFEGWGGRIESPKTGLSEYQPRFEQLSGMAKDFVKDRSEKIGERIKHHVKKLKK